MLKELTLTNFRGFAQHVITFNPVTIIVGRNNAGKSTVVEALRLVSIVVSRYRNLPYSSPPDWLDLPRRQLGVSPSLRGLEISLQNIFHNYAEPPAVIEAKFFCGNSVKIYLGPEAAIYATIADGSGRAFESQLNARAITLPIVSIMPQVGPVNREEVVLTADYIKGAMSSPLSPSHFRNQLRVYHHMFAEFQALAEETWPGLQVRELSPVSYELGERLYLQIRNQDFVGEVATMGHGVQMWLQTMWFLTHARRSATVILDEPDVYMHPDLQRRLARFLRDRFSQVVLTTHSVEIMSEVDPGEILVIDRRTTRSKFAGSFPAVQRVLEGVGSSQNIHLARLWGARRFILVEGKDLKLLRYFQDRLFPDSGEALEAIPNMSIGGWSGWNYALGGSMLLQNAMGEDIKAYCILDSDYPTADEIEERRAAAKAKGVQLHVWAKKEIENYLLVAEAIGRVIAKKMSPGLLDPKAVSAKLSEISESLKDEALDAMATEILTRHRQLGLTGANRQARKIFNQRAQTEGLLSIVSGKAVVAALSAWAQSEFKVSLTAGAIAREMTWQEIPVELRDIVTAIEYGHNFGQGR